MGTTRQSHRSASAEWKVLMSSKVHKKFSKLTKQLWRTQFSESINNMGFRKRLTK